MAFDLLTKYSVVKKEDVHRSFDKIADIIIDGEKVELVYGHARDKVWFTNKRVIALNVQGITGSKQEYRSFPYARISSFSIETAGTFDGDADFKIWVSGMGVFQVKFARNLNIKEISRYLSTKIL